MNKYEQLMVRVNSINFSRKDRIQHLDHIENWKQYIDIADINSDQYNGEYEWEENDDGTISHIPINIPQNHITILTFYNTFPNINNKPIGKECINPKIDLYNPKIYEPSEKNYHDLDMLKCELGMLEYTIDENDNCDERYELINRIIIHKGATFTKYNKKEPGKYDNNDKDIYTIAITEFDNYYQNQHVVVFHNNKCVEWWIGCDDSILDIWDYVWDKYSYPFVD